VPSTKTSKQARILSIDLKEDNILLEGLEVLDGMGGVTRGEEATIINSV